MKKTNPLIVVILLAVAGYFGYRYFYEQSVLEKIIGRLAADSRVAEVLVTAVNFDEEQHKNFTTIKFLEYDAAGKPLEPKYFSFPGNIIQFQSLVVRFDDKFVMAGDRLKGKSVYLFWKAFMLDGANSKEFPINPVQEVPGGYKLADQKNGVEEKFWHNFWQYAFSPEQASRAGVKNVQIEAPGTMFIPGYVYTIKIEHDGGLRIDTTPLPAIMRGEKIP